jgi:hypothetical protein
MEAQMIKNLTQWAIGDDINPRRAQRYREKLSKKTGLNYGYRLGKIYILSQADWERILKEIRSVDQKYKYRRF